MPHFKGFNSLRFFAAFLVVLHHGETICAKNSLPHLGNLPLFKNGATAVEFFFVLSGFLITALLLHEAEKKQTIRIGNFYMRRILRIWPLYFFIFLLGVFFVPFVFNILNLPLPHQFPMPESAVLYCLFLPNLVNAFFGGGLLTPLWSIGVEEQFYLLWAPLVKFFRQKLLWIFLLIILSRILFYVFYFAQEEKNAIMLFGQSLQFECMAVGGLAAYCLKYERFLAKLWQFEWHFGILILMKIFFHEYILSSFWGEIYNFMLFSPVFRTSIWSIIFAGFILCTGMKPRSVFRCDFFLFEKLGEWSYGIYMYHLLVLNFVVLILKKIPLPSGELYFFLAYFSLTFSLLLVVSAVSFHFFEQKFLKIKEKYV
jgi:peptidoglycan/LPS O-acetylase OafA/YrhL